MRHKLWIRRSENGSEAKFSSFNRRPQIDKHIPLNATERQIIQSSPTLYNFGLDSRFGVELVQLVSMLLGQGHSLAASEETDPLTIDECCGGQTARNISRIYSLEKISAGDEVKSTAGGRSPDLWGSFWPMGDDISRRLVHFPEKRVIFRSVSSSPS